jgi:hypothetical protein
LHPSSIAGNDEGDFAHIATRYVSDGRDVHAQHDSNCQG